MFKYVLRRLVYIVVVFLVASVLLFALYKSVPGDPARMMLEGNKASMKPEEYEARYQDAVRRLGLDKPVVIQYFTWLFNTIKGDFGYSLTYKMPVRQMIGVPMKNTIMLNVWSLIPVFLITIPLGIATAVRRGSRFDNAVQVITIIGYSLPFFVIALLFIFLFAVKIPIFPISGVQTPALKGTPTRMFLDKLYHMALPLSVMVFTSLGGLTRYVRATMIEALRMDYIRTARAKGLTEKVVIYSHAFRNALIPFITIMTGWFISIFSGSVVIERTFLWNGMGKVIIDALNQQDFAVSLAMVMFYLILSLIGNLLMDLSYGLADPRVKLS
ncbi:MAG TPA: ABC transporter permease [Sphaerochaeta sp.]|jgi:peptide/nickel transport system permease protein|nr:ABC transporter permease [Spirochaetota bacterium]NLV60753.1 ABC transporter permease [Spirochaetales bacterium]HOE85004.1 ABC transporter permease [Sphaerochaeta sp.]HOQ95000.1 ABC transporter permease [Sphaerochaeta sp.]HPK47686.1 ABC transporter permease [Sphaerochaeta sp.]